MTMIKNEKAVRQRTDNLREKSESEIVMTTENGVQRLSYLTQSAAKKEWKFKAVAGGFAVTAYLGKEKDILIPFEIAGKPVVSIGTGSYYGTVMDTFFNVVKITIPYGVKEINGDAFDSCESLEYVSIPDSVTKIGKYAFSSCKALKTLDIPHSVICIGNRAFAESGLTEITIPASVEELGDYAFEECESLIRLDFEDGFNGYIIQPQTIVDSCTSLSYITLPSPNLNEISFDTRHIKKAVLGQDVNIDLWIPYTTVDEMEFPHGSNIYDIIDGCVYTKDHKKIIFRTSNC